MNRMIAIAGAVALMAGCTTPADESMGADPAAAPMAGMPAPAYMQSAASGDLFEIESSRLALTMSQNPEIRSMAQMLINDHTRMSQQMMAAAQSAGLTPPPPQLLPHHAEAIQRLQAAGPAGFDAAYKQEQIVAHQEALSLHQSYAAEGDTPALRQVAAAAVPIIQGHLGHAQQLPLMAPTMQYQQPQPMAPEVNRAGERGR